MLRRASAFLALLLGLTAIGASAEMALDAGGNSGIECPSGEIEQASAVSNAFAGSGPVERSRSACSPALETGGSARVDGARPQVDRALE